MGRNTSKQDNLEIKKKQITLLVRSYYRKNDFLHKYTEKELDEMALSKFLNSDLSIDEITDQLMRLFLQLRVDSVIDKEIDINDCMFILEQKFLSLIDELNKEKINYRICGLSSVYLLYGDISKDSNSRRINIALDINDFSKFEPVCQRLGLNFVDNRMNPNKKLNGDEITGESEISVADSLGILNIDIQEFQKLRDGRTIIKEYYTDRRGVISLKQVVLSSSMTKIVFDNNQVSYQDRTIPIIAPEYDYIVNNSSDLERKIKYIDFLQDKIDSTKISSIRSLPNNGYSIIYSVVDIDKINFTSELDGMYDALKLYTKNYNSPSDFYNISTTQNASRFTKRLTVVLIIIVIVILFIIGYIFFNLL